MIKALDHIAIAVPDLEKAIQRFVTDFELPLGGTEDVLEAKTTAAFLPLPPTSIELVHPLNDEGPVKTYLEKKGGGLHHLCFRSDDIDADVARLRERVSVSRRCADARGTRGKSHFYTSQEL